MTTLLFSAADGMPELINSDKLPRIDDDGCAARILEIAAAFERAGIEGVRVQCVPVADGRFVILLNLLQDSFGKRLVEFFAEYARKHKKIFSVEIALQIAAAIQKREANHE